MFFKNRNSNRQNSGAYDVVFLMALVILLLVFSAIVVNIDFRGSKDKETTEVSTPVETTLTKEAKTTEKTVEEATSDKDTSTPPLKH